MIMKLNYIGRKSKLKEAVNFANEILNNSHFYSAIGNRTRFDNTELSPSVIAERIRDWEKPVHVRTYWRPFGDSNAKTGRSSHISMNTAKLNRSKKYIVNTLIHEYVHAVDFGDDGQLEYTHVDNDNTNGKENNSAPWAIGKIAEQMV